MLVFMLFFLLTDVAFAEELHAHHSEDEDDDAQDQSQVSQGAHCLAHD